ncbi:MAG TPA: hypothetical protein VGK11_05680, partial [Actinomycetota bacterium]
MDRARSPGRAHPRWRPPARSATARERSGSTRPSAPAPSATRNDKTCAITREDTYGKFTADYSGRLVTDREEVLGYVVNWKIIFSLRTGLG